MQGLGEPLVADYCMYSAYGNQCCIGDACALCKYRKRYLWVIIKTEKIKDKT